MKRFLSSLFIIVILALAASPAYAAGWLVQTSGTPSDLYGVYFRDANVGLAVGSGGTIRKTTNGGSSWVTSASGTTASLGDVVIIPGTSIVYVVGTGGVIRKSIDLGTGWSAQTSGTGDDLNGVSFSTATAGLAVGENGTIRKTTNGGSSWVTSASGTTVTLSDIFLVPGTSIAYAVGKGGEIRKTSNLGTSWTAQDAVTRGDLNAVHFVNASTGWLVGNGGEVRRTTNGGATWTPKSVGTSAHLIDVYFPDIANGWIVGDDGLILKTTNAGDTWTTAASGTLVPLYGVAMFDKNIGWAVGGGGVIRRWDASEPTAVTGLTRTSAGNDTTPTFTWNAATDDVGVSGYVVPNAEGTSTTLGNVLTYTFTSPLADGTYSFWVRAKDTADNIGLASSITFTIDTTVPSAPTGVDRTTANTDATPTFTWNASTAADITSYEIKIDNATNATNVIPSTNLGNVLTYTVPEASTLTSGPSTYTFFVRAVDSSGNMSAFGTVSFIITAAPSNTPPSPPSALGQRDNSASANQLAGYIDNDGTVTFVGTVSDFDSSQAVRLQFEIRPVDTAFTGAQTHTSIPYVVGATAQTAITLANGSYHWQARAIDSADATSVWVAFGANAESAADLTIAITPSSDTTDPDTTITSGPALSTTATSATFTFSATEAATFECSLDGSSYVTCTSPYTISGLSAGSRMMRVRATDTAGNRDNSPASYSWTIGDGQSPPPPPPSSGPPFSLTQMNTDAGVILQGNMSTLLAHLGYATVALCQMSEADAKLRVDRLYAPGTIENPSVRNAIINFTACGTPTTLHLGAGERLGVVNSYKAAFERLPLTTANWFDVMKIANGRFPGETSTSAEAAAKTRFLRIYLRNPNMSQQNDSAAVNVMAYGLRPLPRNVSSEVAAIAIFRGIFRYSPTSAVDWDAVRAIAYSGAQR